MPAYDPALAASLQSLAARAISPLNAMEVLPAPWSLINLITGTTAQGFFAVGQSGTTTQLVLSLGAQWPGWIVAQSASPPLTLSALRSFFYTGGGSAGTAQFDLTMQSLYASMRPTLMTQLTQAVNQLPVVSLAELLVCGQGIGAALAQLAAFDLRAENAAPGQQFAAVRCYAYSSPALANSAFQQQFKQQISDAWAVLASGTSPVDFFPSQPTASQGFVGLGTPQTLSATIPTIEGPWWERSGTFYANAYALAETRARSSSSSVAGARRRTMRARSVRVTSDVSAPSGYSADTASTMASLVAVVNQLAEHPTLPLNIPQPWTLVSALSGAWGALFSSVYPKAYAVAFRAGISYAEAACSLSWVGPVGPNYLPAGAVVHSGAATLYSGVRDALRAQLSALDFTDTTLYLAGHSLGGIIAEVAAGDLFCNPLSSSAPVPYTYCFGTPASVGYSYASAVCPSASCTLQVRIYLVSRDRDTVAPVTWNGLLTTFGNPVSLTGLTAYDDEAFHSLPSYVSLLSPGAAT
jgi:hypothetical protein